MLNPNLQEIYIARAYLVHVNYFDGSKLFYDEIIVMAPVPGAPP